MENITAAHRTINGDHQSTLRPIFGLMCSCIPGPPPFTPIGGLRAIYTLLKGKQLARGLEGFLRRAGARTRTLSCFIFLRAEAAGPSRHVPMKDCVFRFVPEGGVDPCERTRVCDTFVRCVMSDIYSAPGGLSGGGTPLRRCRPGVL
ncbi:hypothetical protein Zmor_019217 [Zophobas morio]|uniref:Uncharacterized protein n=1 Tax=Zophobas morio TaxID=2755281 RepID=A0AA38M8M4_9CUCU|nr:hypothetical protein Zmor_019217 [Zophobas morio]